MPSTKVFTSSLCALVCLSVLGLASEASAQAGELSAPTGYGPPPSAPALPPGALQVRVVGEPEGAVLHHDRGTCETPCELALYPNMHTFGVSLGDGDAESTRPVLIDRPGLLRVSYLRRSGTRATGWALFGIATPLAGIGGALGVAGLMSGNVPGAVLGLLAAAAGGLNLIVALAVGLPLAMVGDATEIRFE